MKNYDLPSESEYKSIVGKNTPKTKKLKGFLRAFLVGGFICITGEMIGVAAKSSGISEKLTSMLIPCILIYFGTLLTGLGVYDRIGKFAGAGSIVPITGFANSMCAPAMEYRREGLITGIGAKIFTLAGPVLTYGISSSVLYGIIYWIKEYAI